MKSETFSYKFGDKIISFVAALQKDKYDKYGFVTFATPEGGSFDVNVMPVGTFAEVYKWVQENNDYML